jgi:hypothetical protein
MQMNHKQWFLAPLFPLFFRDGVYNACDMTAPRGSRGGPVISERFLLVCGIGVRAFPRGVQIRNTGQEILL